MTKIIISIDPALSCGIAIFILNEATASLYLIYSCVVSGDLHRICNFAKFLYTITGDDTELYIEDYVFSKLKCNGANVNSEIRGILKWLYEETTGNKPTVMAIGGWKKLITGKGNASKQYVKEAIEKFGIDCEYSNENGKLLKFKFDESDAIGIGMAGTKTRWIKFYNLRPPHCK